MKHDDIIITATTKHAQTHSFRRHFWTLTWGWDHDLLAEATRLMKGLPRISYHNDDLIRDRRSSGVDSSLTANTSSSSSLLHWGVCLVCFPLWSVSQEELLASLTFSNLRLIFGPNSSHFLARFNSLRTFLRQTGELQVMSGCVPDLCRSTSTSRKCLRDGNGIFPRVHSITFIPRALHKGSWLRFCAFQYFCTHVVAQNYHQRKRFQFLVFKLVFVLGFTVL